MTAARRGTKTRSASAADARSYLNKSREFLRAAEDSLELGNRVAAAGNAVHAGIAAADAITAARATVVWKGEHSQSPAHLERVGGDDGRKAAAQLRRLLPLKNRAEYDPDPISAAEAKAAVTAAARMVRIAEQTVKQVE
jgi:HEPN domain-containing protein